MTPICAEQTEAFLCHMVTWTWMKLHVCTLRPQTQPCGVSGWITPVTTFLEQKQPPPSAHTCFKCTERVLPVRVWRRPGRVERWETSCGLGEMRLFIAVSPALCQAHHSHKPWHSCCSQFHAFFANCKRTLTMTYFCDIFNPTENNVQGGTPRG